MRSGIFNTSGASLEQPVYGVIERDPDDPRTALESQLAGVRLTQERVALLWSVLTTMADVDREGTKR